MPFRDPIVAGVTLVRDAIQSRVYVPGVSGWSINADGSAEFNNATVRGTITAADFQSTNYVAGVSGFDLNAVTNLVEFNTGVRVGPAAGPNLQLGLVVAGAPGLTFHTTAVSETAPGSIEAGIVSAFPVVEIDGPATTNGHSFLQVASSTTTLLGGITCGDNSAPVGANVILSSALLLPPYMQAQFQSVQPINGAENALLLGNGQATHLRLSHFEVQAIAAGAGGPLNLNPAGGNLVIGGRTTGANLQMNFNQLWALNNGAASGLFLNFSSSGTVQIGNGTAAGADMLCVAMRSVKFANVGPGGTITSTAFVSSNVLGTTFTVPASGTIRVDYSGRMNIVTTTAAQRAFMGVQVQSNNSAGPVVYATTDTESIEVGLPATISGNAGIFTLGKTIVIPGLTPGATVFVVITNRVTANTASIFVTNAQITVTPEM